MDLLIKNARIVDVFSGTVFPGQVAVDQGRILHILDSSRPADGAPSAPEAREVFDAQGAFLLPGLVDSHVHMESSMLCPARFAELVLPRGTTTVIADPHEIANVQGLAGIRYMLDASADLPLDVRIMLPSCVPALPVEDAGAVLNAADLAPLMSHPRVCGLGEMMNMPGVLASDTDVTAKIALAEALGKQVDGHSPGFRGPDLERYAAAGIGTDHECATVEEMLERIRCGMYVILREGSAARNLTALAAGVNPANARRCLFCTDDRQAVDILERGHIDSHLRLAVAAGIPAIEAIRMATLNPAECYGLRHKGGIAPGRAADLVLMNNLTDFQPLAVWAAGRLVAREGRILSALPQLDPGAVGRSVNMAPLPASPFLIHAPSGRARIIRLQPHSLVTLADEQNVHTTPSGHVDLALNPGLLKLAVVERHHATGKIGVGLLDKNYGLRGGAIALSIAHDSHNIVVAGDSDSDMALAVNEVARLGGGIVMASSGSILASLALPVAGLMSDLPAPELAEHLRHLLTLARSHYHISPDADAFMTLSFLALPVIPELKLTARGLFDVRSFQFVPVAL